MDQDRNVVSLDDFKGNEDRHRLHPLPVHRHLRRRGVCDPRQPRGAQRPRRRASSSSPATPSRWPRSGRMRTASRSRSSPTSGRTARSRRSTAPSTTAVGVANRMSFVLDADGVVRTIIDSGSLGTAREFADTPTPSTRSTDGRTTMTDTIRWVELSTQSHPPDRGDHTRRDRRSARNHGGRRVLAPRSDLQHRALRRVARTPPPGSGRVDGDRHEDG